MAQQVNFNNTRLDSVFIYFTNLYNYKFAYDNQLVENYFIDYSIQEKDPELTLKQILNKCDLHFEYLNEVYIIIPNKESKRKINITGIIKDKETGETLPFAHIMNKKHNIYCVANQDGYFSIFDLANDTVSLIISYVGYMPSIYNLKLSNDDNFKIFYISPQNHEIAEVLIKAETDNTIQAEKDIGLTTLNPSDIYYLPNSGENDILKLVQMMPGIRGTNESSADLIIRGEAMDKNLILFDDFTLYHVDHFYGMISALNPKVIKHVQVCKGGFDASYGGRTNSVVNIVGKSGNNIKPSAELGVNMLNVNLMIETPVFNKGTILIAGRRSYTDILQTPLFKQMFDYIDFTESNNYYALSSDEESNAFKKSKFYFYDVNAKFTYSISNEDNISVSYFSSLDNLKRDENIYIDFSSDDDVLRNNGLSMRWVRQWNSKLYSKILIGNSKFFNEFLSTHQLEIEATDSIVKVQNTNNVNESSFKVKSNYKFSEKLSVDIGYELTNQKTKYNLKYSYKHSEAIGGSISNDTYLHSGFLQGIFSNQEFDITAGIRGNYYKQTDQFYFEPRLNMGYNLTNDWRLKGAVGKYYQFLTKVFTGTEKISSKSLWLTSDNKYVPVNSSNQFIVGLQYSKNNFLFDVEYYRKKIDGEIKFIYDFSDDDNLVIDSSFYLFESGASFVRGASDIQGLDVLISKDFGKFYGWISYSLSENKNKFDLIHDGLEFRSINDQKHEFKIAGIRSFWKLNLGLTWIYGSGFAFSDPYYFVGKDNNRAENNKIPDYHKLDCNITYKFDLSKINGEIGISFLNIYNQKNKIIKEQVPYEYDDYTQYNLTSIDLQGRAISTFFNIRF